MSWKPRRTSQFAASVYRAVAADGVGIANLIFTAYSLTYGGHFLIDLPGLKAADAAMSKDGRHLGRHGGAVVQLSPSFVCLAQPERQAGGWRSKVAVGGAMLASLNTASEYSFMASSLRCAGFVADALKAIPNPLINQAITINILSGITGSSSGGMSIALAAMADRFIEAAHAARIPLEVMHRVASMAAGNGYAPHNGAIITLLAVTGLTHRQAYKPILGITLFKILGVFHYWRLLRDGLV